MSAAPRDLRPPAVAGAFYPSDAVELTQLLERCFTGPRGPGELPVRQRGKARHIRAAIVPHAGYVYSGPIAAHAFAAIAAERAPESVLLLGVNHRARGAPVALTDEDWETPLGVIPTDGALLRALDRPPATVDRRAHALEHSLEVEMPFVQYVLPHPRVVALSVSFATLSGLAEVGVAVARAIRGRDVLLVASTDFSHYVPAETARRLDRMAIDRILELQPEALYETVRTNDISMCGIAPVTALLCALEGETLLARLLRWGHSGEAEPMREVVGYASILLEAPEAIAPAGPT